MRILIVHSSLDAQSGAEAICTAKLVEALDRLGCEIHLVTGGIGDARVAGSIHLLPNDDLREEPLLVRLDRKINRFPEVGWRWARAAGNLVSALVSERRVDVVYSRAMPFVSHLPPYFVRGQVRVPWVAHFSDPWPDVELFGSRNSAARIWWHQRIVAAADAVTFPSERIADFCISRQWGGRGKPQVPPIIVPHQLPSAEYVVDSAPPSRKRVALHCGTFYGARRPGVLVEAWAKFLTAHPDIRESVELHHVGPFSTELAESAAEADVTDSIVQLGRVDYSESLRLMARATVLVLVESSDVRVSNYFPSKLTDYLWARRPILALTPTAGSVADLLGNDYSLRVDPWDVHGAARIFELALLDESGMKSDSLALENLRTKLRPDAVAADLLKRFQQLL